jgi:hypothetical protein
VLDHRHHQHDNPIASPSCRSTSRNSRLHPSHPTAHKCQEMAFHTGRVKIHGASTPRVPQHLQHNATRPSSKVKGQIVLKKEVHNALDDFRWMHNNIASRPTCIAEIIPLLPAAEGHHNASGIGAGGVWFLGDHITLGEGTVGGKPILWRYCWETTLRHPVGLLWQIQVIWEGFANKKSVINW